jgi:parallel beta-helix repeat protein
MYRKIAAVWVSILILLGCVTIISDFTQPARGTIIFVDDVPGSGSGNPAENYTSIQDAINASFPGDTIYVYSGIYYENLNVNKTINLTGENKETTIIDGLRNDNTISVRADYVNISGFTAYNSSRVWANPDGGIKLFNVDNATIKDNICTGNIIGIVLDNSHSNIIDNNKCNSNTEQGITIRLNSDYNIIINNEAKSNKAGIVLYGACSNNIISYNNASSNNPYHGINLDTNCHWNNITNNFVGSNTDEGIYLFGNSDNNQIKNNTLKSNGDHGVILSSTSDNNKVFHNNFFANPAQASDFGSGNIWDNGYPSGGNYWSNFDDPGEGAYDDYQGINQSINGSDGIVDKGSGAGGGKNPYNVQGGSKDNYPFIEPVYFIPPLAPKNLTAIAGNEYVNVSWEEPISNSRLNITGYNVYRNDIPGIYIWVPANQLWYYDTNVQNGITYTYNVSAVNDVGEGSNSADVSGIPKTNPSAPRNPYTIAANGYINLYWDAPGDNGGAAITNYRIYRGEFSGGETFLAQVPQITFYIDSDVVSENTYYYKISAVNIAGEGPLSEETNATFYFVPTKPTDLTENKGDSYVNLSWEEPSSDGGSPVTGYLVYRNRTSDGTIVIFEVGNFLFFNDSTAKNGVTYEYIISAKNAVGEGPQSQEIITTPMGFPHSPINIMAVGEDTLVNLSWEAPISDGGSEITGHNIYRQDTTFIYTTTSANQLWYHDTNVLNGVTYTYYISAINVMGEGILSNGIGATPMTVPSPPTNMQLSAGDGYVNLTWIPPNNDGGSPIQSYRLYRSDSPGSESLLVEIGYSLYYNDTSVINNRTYVYRISVKNAVGESEKSNEVNGTPKILSVPEPKDEKEPDSEIPIWLWILHAVIITLIVILFVLLLMKKKKNVKSSPQEQMEFINEDKQKDEMLKEPPIPENTEDLPPPPPPP